MSQVSAGSGDDYRLSPDDQFRCSDLPFDELAPISGLTPGRVGDDSPSGSVTAFKISPIGAVEAERPG
jgi:hypothetical protein